MFLEQTKMASRKFEKVRYRLASRLHKAFAKAVRQEANARQNSYRVGTFFRNGRSIHGWFEVAEWLERRAFEYENMANRNNEPRF